MNSQSAHTHLNFDFAAAQIKLVSLLNPIQRIVPFPSLSEEHSALTMSTGKNHGAQFRCYCYDVLLCFFAMNCCS